VQVRFTSHLRWRCSARAVHLVCLLPKGGAERTGTKEPYAAGPGNNFMNTLLRHDMGGLYLNVLQSKVLRCSTPMRSEPRPCARYENKQVTDRSDDGVHVEIDMITGRVRQHRSTSHRKDDTFQSLLRDISPYFSSLHWSSRFPCNMYGIHDCRTPWGQKGCSSSPQALPRCAGHQR
jgi:hypothetical protein